MEYLTEGYQPLIPAEGRDYFSFQLDNQMGAGCLQSNTYLDQFILNLSLEQRDDFLNFIPSTDGTQFNIPDIARVDACDIPGATATELTTWTSNKSVVHHGQMTPGKSHSPSGIPTCTPTSAAKKSIRHPKSSIQDRNGDEKPRRRRRSKKANTLSPEDQQARRKKFLERNRKAATKCRSHKKEWQEKLVVHAEDLTLRNAA